MSALGSLRKLVERYVLRINEIWFTRPSRLTGGPLLHRWLHDDSVGRRIEIAWRLLISRVLPFDPLCEAATDSLPQIDVMIPAHPKDLDVLRYCVAACGRGTRNPISRIVVLVPADSVAQVQLVLGESVTVISEADVLGNLSEWIKEHIPLERQGWVAQQCLKLLWVLGNEQRATLVLDADTVLLRRRTWLDAESRQLLAISAERHEPYVEHADKCWNLHRATQAISYVTHHQLMQPDVVKAMFPDGASSIRQWLSRADFSVQSALSEYHCYGAWIRTNAESRVRLASFSNRGLSKAPVLHSEVDSMQVQAQIQRLADRHGRAGSASFHSWNRVP